MRRGLCIDRQTINRSMASIGADVNRPMECPPMRKPKQRKPLNDLSRSLTALDVNHTLIAVIEMGLKSWLVAGIIPGVERPFEESPAQRERIAGLARSVAKGSREGWAQDQADHGGVRGRPRRLLAGAMAQRARHRGPRHSCIERGGVAGAPVPRPTGSIPSS